MKREVRPASRGELRRMAGLLVGAEEAARRRAAHELDDDLNQRLAALALELAVVRRELDDDSRSRGLAAIGEGMAELSQDLGRLSCDLHPSVLERFGLVEALSSHCAELGQCHGLEVRLRLRGTGPRDADRFFSPEVALGLYRIAQEALANAVRHAAASSVQVTLAVAGGEARLAVADDGVGFDPEAARRAGGRGLVSLEEWARLLGGRCRITSAPGAGTVIEAVVPVGHSADW